MKGYLEVQNHSINELFLNKYFDWVIEMRIKLKFSEEFQLDYPKCLFYTEKSIKTIEDLSNAIYEQFNLSKMTKGIILEVDQIEGFPLLPFQPVKIINEEDVIK